MRTYIELAAAGAPNPLMPATAEIIAGSIAFLLLFLVMRSKVVPMFEKAYAERTAAIEGGIAKAEKLQQEAATTLSQYRQNLAEAKSEAAKIRSTAESERATLISEARNEAQKAAQVVTQQANAQIEVEKTKAVNELRLDVSNLALGLAEKIVGASLSDDAKAKAVIDQFIKDLESVKGK